MTLQSQVSALATRVGDEFNAIRQAVGAEFDAVRTEGEDVVRSLDITNIVVIAWNAPDPTPTADTLVIRLSEPA